MLLAFLFDAPLYPMSGSGELDASFLATAFPRSHAMLKRDEVALRGAHGYSNCVYR